MTLSGSESPPGHCPWTPGHWRCASLASLTPLAIIIHNYVPPLRLGWLQPWLPYIVPSAEASRPLPRSALVRHADITLMFSAEKNTELSTKKIISPLISQLQSLSLPHKYVINYSLIIDLIFTHFQNLGLQKGRNTFKLLFKLILRRFEVVSWCLEWECCTFWKIERNSFKSINSRYYTMALTLSMPKSPICDLIST